MDDVTSGKTNQYPVMNREKSNVDYENYTDYICMI